MNEPAGPSGEKKKSKAVQIDMASPWQKYANLILIPLIIGLTVFLLIRFRMNTAADAKRAESEALTAIRVRLNEFRVNDFAAMVGPEQLAAIRDSNFTSVDRSISDLLAGAKDPVVRAEALIAKGDLNWQTANFPQLPGATTRPSLAGTKTAADYLSAAETAYASVLRDHVDQRFSAVSARLGLGAIAENRGQWDEANKHYQVVADDSNAPESFRSQARSRLEIVKMIREPLYVGAKPVTTQPAATQPATQPTTASAVTQPAAMVEPTTTPAVAIPTTRSAATTQPAK